MKRLSMEGIVTITLHGFIHLTECSSEINLLSMFWRWNICDLRNLVVQDHTAEKEESYTIMF